jgi:hypothetical protein
MTNSYKKESPLVGFAGFGGGAPGLSYKSAASKTYVDDVYSTYVYTGNNTAGRAVNNGIDLSGEGGLTWIKRRGAGTGDHILNDTVRGAGEYLQSNDSVADSTDTNRLTSFTSTGFTVGTDATVNYGHPDPTYSGTYSSWSFRKAKGFFDVVTYTGAGGTQNISHNLGCIPGCIIIKRTNSTNSWRVYHRGTDSSAPQNYSLCLNDNSAREDYTYWNDTAPTETQFTVADSDVNGSGGTFVAYLFAGGASTTDKAVEFDGDDYLTMPVSNTDFDWGASDSLTIECFLNLDDVSSMAYNSIINRWAGSNYSFGLDVKNNGNLFFYFGSGTGSITTAESSGTTISTNTWYHVAVVKDGTTGRFFINGKACGTFTWNLASSNSSQTLHVGNLGDGNVYDIDGELSNVRMTMGQALYTTNFNVPHDPLTTTSQGAVATNVKLLCCNQSTTTGSTVAPGTITANGDPTVTTNSSIFDDTAAHIFGEDGDKGIIKTGRYIGNGSDDGPEINLGFEPQWILLKRTDSTDNWPMYDVMRGITTFGTDNQLRADQDAVEHTTGTTVDVTSTGFNITTLGSEVNASNGEYIYMAIRRPDGYVGKPAEVGTDVFTMDVGNGNSYIPSHDSGFPVDFAFVKQFGGTSDWDTSARLMSEKFVKTNTTAGQDTSTGYTFDSSVGWGSASWLDSAVQSWMWKRGAGMDVLVWEGNSVVGRKLSHSLNSVPEMFWVKMRTGGTNGWQVYHKGLNDGTDPQNWSLSLQMDQAENGVETWQYTAPTSTHVTLSANGTVNLNGRKYVMMLFASVDGISKVGSFSGSNSTVSVNLGFQPRFLILKNASNTGNWVVVDTTRGWGSGDDQYMRLNTNGQNGAHDLGAPTSTGFDVTGGSSDYNAAGSTYIYYAHA